MAKSPLDAATEKGRAAYASGLPESSCPYPDKRQETGRLTFSRAFRNAWRDGYREARNADQRTDAN